MPKQILHKEEARRALERGVNALANTVTVTLGPKGPVSYTHLDVYKRQKEDPAPSKPTPGTPATPEPRNPDPPPPDPPPPTLPTIDNFQVGRDLPTFDGKVVVAVKLSCSDPQNYEVWVGGTKLNLNPSGNFGGNVPESEAVRSNVRIVKK